MNSNCNACASRSLSKLVKVHSPVSGSISVLDERAPESVAARVAFIELQQICVCHADAVRIFSFCMAELPSVDIAPIFIGLWRAQRFEILTPRSKPALAVGYRRPR